MLLLCYRLLTTESGRAVTLRGRRLPATILPPPPEFMVLLHNRIYFVRSVSLMAPARAREGSPSYCSEGVLHGFVLARQGKEVRTLPCAHELFCEACETVVSVVLPEFLCFFVNNVGVLVGSPDII